MGDETVFSPSRSYKITLKIKGEEYSNDLTNVRVSSSLATGYQIVVLTVLINPQTISLNKLYGQDSINLSMVLLDDSEFERERLDFDLMVLNTEYELAVSEILNTNGQVDRTHLSIITVTRIPFQIMSTNVGCVFGYKGGVFIGNKTVKEMIETMISTYVPQAKLEYDAEEVNPDLVPQCCIPPNTLYKAISLMDSNHGIYNGVPVTFCQFDGTVQIMNLSARIKKNFTITIEHLTSDSNDSKNIDAPTNDRTKFYTYDNLYSKYVGNAKFGVLGNTLKHIVLPSNQLSHTITQDLGAMCEKYGIIGTGNKETVYIDKPAINRVAYYIENNGDDLSEVHANSKIAKQLSNLARLNFSVERNLAIDVLIKIGSVVKLETKAIDHIDISGKYILFSSDITWVKDKDWQTVAKLELIRTNKSL